MSALDDPMHRGGPETGEINKRKAGIVGLPVESGLHSKSLETHHLSDDVKHARGQAEQAAFGEDFSGKRGLSGITGAVRQIASEVVERFFSGFTIAGDQRNIKVTGKGRNWQISWNRPVFVPQAPTTVANEPLPTPWQPIPGTVAGTIAVVEFSTLLDTDLAGSYTITSIGDDFALAVDEYLFLHLEYSGDELVTAITLEGGAAWSGYPDVVTTTGTGVEGDPYIVTDTYFLIAYTKLNSDPTSPAGVFSFVAGGDTIKVIRCVFDPLALVTVNRNGLVFDYPVPGPRPVIP